MASSALHGSQSYRFQDCTSAPCWFQHISEQEAQSQSRESGHYNAHRAHPSHSGMCIWIQHEVNLCWSGHSMQCGLRVVGEGTTWHVPRLAGAGTAHNIGPGVGVSCNAVSDQLLWDMCSMWRSLWDTHWIQHAGPISGPDESDMPIIE